MAFSDRVETSEAAHWVSPRAVEFSTWHGHVAFAHWIVAAARPRAIVELGTHNGVSYFAFCHAVARAGLACTCRAVDTWQGDPHAGFYGRAVYEGVRAFNDARFSAFSRLLRMTFDQALAEVPDGSVDLLHIDGLHTYEAVRHDFETWLPKLSGRGIVLFHDVAVRGHGFGVWRLWDELSARYPSFRFEHSAGLGMLVVGDEVAPEVRDLCALSGGGEAESVRAAFEQLSNRAQVEGLKALPRYRRTPAWQPEGENVALHRRTAQSSHLEGLGLKPGGAVSGTRTGGCGFHTHYQIGPWWSVDLGDVRRIQAIVLYNRMDELCIARTRNVEVFASRNNRRWTRLYAHDGTVFGGLDGEPLVVDLAGAKARYVKLQLRGEEYFHLDEVEIYA